MKTHNKTRLMPKGIFSLLMATFVALGFYACNDISGPGHSPDNGKGHMNVHLTDAPGDYDAVNVDIQAIKIHYTSFETDTTNNEGEWIELPVEPVTVNLLDFSNGLDTLLSSADLDAGHYREMRLVLGDNNSVVVDGKTERLKVPSGQSSGFKIKFRTDLESGENLNVTIDFNADKSVHQAGHSGKYILKPVLHAYVEEGEPMESGSLSGVVDPMEANPSVYAIMDSDTTTTSIDTTGSFKFEDLNAGEYSVWIEAGNEQYADTTLNEVEVESGQNTDLGTITLNQQ